MLLSLANILSYLPQINQEAKKILQFLEILVTKKLFTQAAKNIFNLIEFFTNFCSINLIEI